MRPDEFRVTMKLSSGARQVPCTVTDRGFGPVGQHGTVQAAHHLASPDVLRTTAGQQAAGPKHGCSRPGEPADHEGAAPADTEVAVQVPVHPGFQVVPNWRGNTGLATATGAGPGRGR